jgi:ATP-binding cassette subfamily B protein/subfamily B ATP-binding cassette protein MsbA
MSNFRRALHLTLRYRWTLAGIVLSSLLVAAFWGGNIGALYPIVEVAIRGKPLQSWVEDEIAKAEQKSEQIRTELVQLDEQLAAGPAPSAEQDLRKQRERLATRLKAEQAALAMARRVQPWIQRYFPTDPFETIVMIVLLLMVATIVKNIFIFANNMLAERIVQLVAFDLRRELYHHTLRMDLSEFGEERTGSMLSRFNVDLSFMLKGLRALFGKALREPLKGLACLIGAALISWRLLAFSLLLTPLAALLIRLLAGSIKRANRRAMEENAQLLGVLSESFSGMQTVKAFTMEKYERGRFRNVSKECLRKAMKIVLYDSLAKPATEILGMTVVFTALLAGAYLVLNQETHLLGIRMCNRPLSIPALLCFYGLLIGTSDPARKLSDVFNGLQGGVAAADRVYALLDRQPVVQDPPQSVSPPRPHRRLVFDHIDFHYLPEHPVLQDINLSLTFGETLCIVGPNGCGKTTLANLLPRFYDPTAGAITLDGVDLRQLRLRDLRRVVGVVTQQTLLFDDTVYNNIRYGTMQASREQVLEAARQAHAHRFIVDKLDHGYDTLVGPGGNRLSGGQRQRIALARAILRDPDILILDEATSKIDIESEQQIHEALQHFVRDRTAIIITHRLSTLDLADRILVLDKGRAADIGTHEELLCRCELYRRLHDIQLRQTA